ncbi:restriction endonuclease [Arthrobacter citreus]|uniref:restriction endonuclease n=1 Tax=Arthrobacter citreus TaxID=1670 RepID=UPI0036DC5651
MDVDDTVVMPLKRTSEIAIGTIDSGYTYLDTPDPQLRHVRKVTWKVTDLARSRVKQDLLYSLGALSTVCQIQRNDAEQRLRSCMNGNSDPGARLGAISSIAAPVAPMGLALVEAQEEVADAPVDLARYAADSIASRLIEAYSGHKMEGLIADLLRSAGYVCTEHGEGTDDGIDIVAGKGILGLEPPRIIVQVKSQAAPVDSPTVSQLHGSLSIHGADQGLLVAWGASPGLHVNCWTPSVSPFVFGTRTKWSRRCSSTTPRSPQRFDATYHSNRSGRWQTKQGKSEQLEQPEPRFQVAPFERRTRCTTLTAEAPTSRPLTSKSALSSTSTAVCWLLAWTASRRKKPDCSWSRPRPRCSGW